MHRHASVEICKDKIYVHASLGGHPHIARPASYAQETKTYFKLGPLEVFRGLLNYSISLVSRYGTLDLMRAHDQSFCPGRFHVIFISTCARSGTTSKGEPNEGRPRDVQQNPRPVGVPD